MLEEGWLEAGLRGNGIDIRRSSGEPPFGKAGTRFTQEMGDANFLSEYFGCCSLDFVIAPAEMRWYKGYNALANWLYTIKTGGILAFDGVLKDSVLHDDVRRIPFCEVVQEKPFTVLSKLPIESKKRVFRHSGARGDIVYALPAIISMGGGDLKVSLASKAYKSAPMTGNDVTQLAELLETIPCLDSVSVYEGGRVDCNLNRFRNVCSDYAHLARCHLLTFGVGYDLSQPWLDADVIGRRQEAPIVVSRSGRYHGYFDWDVLKGREHECVFLGTKGEYEEFEDVTGIELPYLGGLTMLEMARVIAGSSLFIGNQSFPYAVAESMKVPRVLEVFMDALNSLPSGRGGYTRLTKQLIYDVVDAGKLPDNPGRDYRMTFNENRGRARSVAMMNSFAKLPLTCTCLVYGEVPQEDLDFIKGMGMLPLVVEGSEFEKNVKGQASTSEGDYLCIVDARDGFDRGLVQRVYELMMRTKKDGIFGEMGVEDGKMCCVGPVFGVSRRAYDDCGIFVGGESLAEMTARYGSRRYRCFSVGVRK